MSALHTVTGKNHYCGPVALSAITGLPTDQVASIARERFGRRAIKGMYTSEAMYVLQKLGCEARCIFSHRDLVKKPRLAEWMDTRPLGSGGVLLINVTDHFVAAKGSIIVCSLQGREERHYQAARCANMRVEYVWEIAVPKRLHEQPEKKRIIDPYRALFVKRCKELGLTYELSADGWADLSNDHSVYIGTHGNRDWGYALDSLNEKHANDWSDD